MKSRNIGESLKATVKVPEYVSISLYTEDTPSFLMSRNTVKNLLHFVGPEFIPQDMLEMDKNDKRELQLLNSDNKQLREKVEELERVNGALRILGKYYFSLP